LDDWREVGWSIQVNVLQRVLISFNHSIQAIALRVKDVAIQSKAVRSPVHCWWHCGPETECWDLFVRIIVLENFSNRFDGLQILVFVVVKVVKGIFIIWVAIAQREVDCDAKLDLTATEDIFEERVPCVEVQVDKLNFLVLGSPLDVKFYCTLL
jgi:hypothetical protein